MKINNERLLEFYEYDPDDFEESSDIIIDKLTSTLMDTIDSIQNEYYKKLFLTIFEDNEIRQAFLEKPASVGMHHSHKHGNLEHTISMIEIFQTLDYESSWEKRILFTRRTTHSRNRDLASDRFFRF